ncbi:MAG: DUF1841 family protein [Gammaproteobacteria bacterium]|nr:DUF1841 family protein [Gammaproteobacteria bacterium]
MLFTQDRLRTRHLFCAAWKKHLKQEPLEPLEKQIVDLLKDHPEYHPLLQNPDDTLDKDFTSDHASGNPFLHLGLHLALREQVGTDRPIGIANITRSLLLKHQDGHTVEHLMMEPLGRALWDAQRIGQEPDSQAYLEELRRLLN